MKYIVSLLFALCVAATPFSTMPTKASETTDGASIATNGTSSSSQISSPDFDPATLMHGERRMHIFSRSQWKYGLQRNDYLNRWVDRPLFTDPGLVDSEADRGNIPKNRSFLKTREIVERYGLDGLAFFPETSGRLAIYDLTQQNPSDHFQILSEFITKDDLERKITSLRAALDNPASFRIDGKLVVTSYQADSISAEKWEATLHALREAVGDTFLFLPSINQFGKRRLANWMDLFSEDKITPEDEAEIKEGLRSWLRVGDGLHYASMSVLTDGNRRFNPVFYRDFIIRLLKKTLAEAEFDGKLLSLAALVGHENVTKLGYTCSSDGTKTLRHSLETAIEAAPDLINLPEWDEQNENTSLRPTIYNGTSSMRILRYYMSKLKGETLTPLPGDKTHVPNLVVSYRKLLTLGESMEIELLHIPDGSVAAGYEVQVLLATEDGKVVFTSEPQHFQGDALEEHTITLPSEDFASSLLLHPRLTIQMQDKKVELTDGLHYIDIRPTWNWDYKWVKQPLRDLIFPSSSSLQIAEADQDGIRSLSASITSPESLAYVEILDNDDVVYSHSPETQDWWENEQQIVVSLAWQSLDATISPREIDGEIVLHGAEGRWKIQEHKFAPIVEGQRLRYLRSAYNTERVLIAVPRKDLSQAELEIALPGIYEGRLPLTKIRTEKAFGVSGPDQFALVASSYHRTSQIPAQLDTTEVKFRIPVLPDLPHSVFHLQAIGTSGHLYRSKPIKLGEGTKASGRNASLEEITVYSDTAKEAISAKVPAGEVPTIVYPIDQGRGTVLWTEAGRSLSGALGPWSHLVTERGGGQSTDGSPIAFDLKVSYPANTTQNAPRWIATEDGAMALRFDGKGTFLTLPQGAIPRRAAYTISMDIRPTEDKGRELLLANRSNYLGSLALYRVDGELQVSYSAQGQKTIPPTGTGLKLPKDTFSHLEICYDQKSVVLSVDGEIGQALPAPGPGNYDTLSIVGGFGKDWFAGDIMNLKIRHGD